MGLHRCGARRRGQSSYNRCYYKPKCGCPSPRSVGIQILQELPRLAAEQEQKCEELAAKLMDLQGGQQKTEKRLERARTVCLLPLLITDSMDDSMDESAEEMLAVISSFTQDLLLSALSYKAPWAARYNTWLLNKLTPKGIVFFFLFFSFLQGPLPVCWSLLMCAFFAAYAQPLMGGLLINKSALDTCQHVWDRRI